LCGCDNVFSCHTSAGFYDFDKFDNNDHFDVTKVPSKAFVDGWKVACWPLESLLISTLQSLYNQTELNKIVFIENLVNNLFVEKWLQKLNYSSYFAQSQPQLCEYSINERPNILYTITSLLGLYGDGLSVVLHFIISYIDNFLLKRIEQRTIVSTDSTTEASK
jgi:hypothetical protein